VKLETDTDGLASTVVSLGPELKFEGLKIVMLQSCAQP
jgi:hypothetical protein